MGRKLKCIIVDDDPEAHQTIIEVVKDSPIAEITHSFYRPSEFLEKVYTIDMDVVFLDIVFPNDTIQGFDVAPIIQKEKKIIIFISGNNEFIVEACRYAGAIDVIPKPNTKERLADALAKAWKLYPPVEGHELHEKGHALFHVAGKEGLVSLYLPDMYFVKTAKGDPRNKEVIFKDGKKETLMNYSFNQLLKLCENLARINESELISYDIVDSVEHDTIFRKPGITDKIPKWLTLSKTYRKAFRNNFS